MGASTQSDLNNFAHSQCIDVQVSGSTAVTVVWRGDTVCAANIGDSKCAIGYEKPKRLHYINACGGEVRSQTYPDELIVHRIFLKDRDFPGVAMSRTFGDDCVKRKV